MKPNLPYFRGFLLSLTLLATACGGLGEEASSAEDADESVAVTSSESALTSELADEVAQPVSASPEALAKAAMDRLSLRFQPASCFTATQSGATVTYVLTDCTGRYGLVHVTGTLTAVYSRASGGGVQVVVTGSGVKVNQATVDLNSTVVATQANGVKQAQVTTDAHGTGPRGGDLSRQGAYTVEYDTAAECLTVNGTWTTKVGALRTGSTVVSAYQRCKGTCPAAGGTITHTGARGLVVTVSYDGSAAAKWSTSAGKSGTVTLQCTK